MSRTIPILAVALALGANSQASAQLPEDTQPESNYDQSDDTQESQQGQREQEDDSELEAVQQEEIPEQPFDTFRDENDGDSRADNRSQRQQQREQQQSQRRQQQELNFGARFTDAEDALTVGTIAQGTLAADVGLRQGDQIVAVGERAVFTEDELNRALMRSRTSQSRIPIIVRRDSGRATLYVQPQRLRDSFVLSRRPISPDLGVNLITSGDDGRLVVRNVTGGIGARLGLRPNDVVVSVGGRRIASPAQFERTIYDVDFADARPLPVIVVRDGRRMTLYLDSDVPDYGYADDDFARDQAAWLGVTLDTSHEDFAVVQSVVRNSPAEEAGVRRGDWIVRINGRRVNSPRHLTSLVRSMDPGEELEIQVARRVSRTLVARLDADPTFESRQALRPTYEFFDGDDVLPDAIPFDPDADRRGLRDRVGPDERGLRDRLDPDEVPDEPRGVFPR